MPTAKISDHQVEQILRLKVAGKTTSEIAQALNIKRLQVTAILAHADIHKQASAKPVEDSPVTGKTPFDDEIPPSDIAVEIAVADKSTERPTEDNETEDGIYVGDDREYGDPLYWVPWDSQICQNPHLMIVGESGSGKTYATQCLVAELAQADIPSVIFDYGQGFELDTLESQFSKFSKPIEYLIGEKGLSINPIEIFARDVKGPSTVATRISDVFDAVYRLGDIQRKVLIDAVVHLFERRGIRVNDPVTWEAPGPNLTDLQEELEQLASDKTYPQYKNAQTVSARLTTFFMLNSFQNDGTSWAWNKLITDRKNRVHVLQFRGLEGRTQRVVVELLLWHLFFFLKSEGQHPLRMYCVLDEAHHLSFRDGGPVDSLLREARKFGLGLIFASQQPEDFSPAAYSNSASKLVFQTTDPGLKVSKFLASKSLNSGGPDEIHETIASLPRGEALFITANRAKTLRVSDLNKRSTLWKRHE